MTEENGAQQLREEQGEVHFRVGGDFNAEVRFKAKDTSLLDQIPRRSLIIAGALVTVGAMGGITAVLASSVGTVPGRPPIGVGNTSPIVVTTPPSGGSSTSSAPTSVYTEIAYNRNSVPTFSNLASLSGSGPSISFNVKVGVSCKIYDPSVPSATPDGYLYRIATMPWNNNYYAVANAFLNGDPPGGPYQTNVDNHVPDC